MDILDHPDAQALLNDAELSAAAVRSCADQLTAFVQRYLPGSTARSSAATP